MAENIVTGQDNHPVVEAQSTRPKPSPIRAIPQSNPFVQLAQQGQVDNEAARIQEEDQVLAQAEEALENPTTTPLEPDVSILEMYETLDPSIRPAPNVNPWLNENRQLFQEGEQSLLDEYDDIDLTVESPTYPILARPTGISRDVDIMRLNDRIERNSNRPFIEQNPEGTSTPGARVRMGQPDPIRNIARGIMPPPQGRPGERENLWGLRNTLGQVTSFGRMVTGILANAGNLPALILNPLLRMTQTEEEQTPSTNTTPLVDDVLNFLGNAAPVSNPSRIDTDQGVSPYISDPMRGYFGEFGTGVTGAGIAAISSIGNLNMASVYSIGDLQRALNHDYNIGLLSRTGPGFFYQLYRAGTEGLSGGGLPGGRDLYALPGFRYRQAFSFTDLGFTNFRQPNSTRYLATIDPDAPVPLQVAQGALGLALDAGAFGWVDDAVWGVFGRGGRALLRGNQVTSIPPSVLEDIPDPWTTPSNLTTEAPPNVTPGDLDVWGDVTSSVGGLKPAEIPVRPLPSNPAASLPTGNTPNYALPPLSSSFSSLAPETRLLPAARDPETPLLPSRTGAVHLEDLNGNPIHPLPRRGTHGGFEIPNPWLLSNDIDSVVERAVTPDGSAFVTPTRFIEAFEHNRFIHPPQIDERTVGELSDYIHQVFPELSDVPSFTTRESRILNDLSNGLVPPYGRRLHVLDDTNIVHDIRLHPILPPQDAMGIAGRPPYMASYDAMDATVLDNAGNRVNVSDLNDIEYQRFLDEFSSYTPRQRRRFIRVVPDEPAEVIPFPIREDAQTRLDYLKRVSGQEAPEEGLRRLAEATEETIEESTQEFLQRNESFLQALGIKTQYIQDEMLSVQKHTDELLENLIDLPTPSDVVDEIGNRNLYGDFSQYEVLPDLPVANANLSRKFRTVDVDMSTPWYHGTRNAIRDLVEIDPKVGSSSNELGAGVYLTQNPKLAEVYAQAERAITNPLIETRQLPNGQVLEVEVLVGKTIDASATPPATPLILDLVGQAFDAATRIYYNPREVRNIWLDARQAYAKAHNNAPVPELMFQQFQKKIAELLIGAGYDSIYDPATKTLVILDPVSITTKRSLPVVPTMSPREARLAADSVLRSAYRDNPVVEGMVGQSMLKVEKDLMKDMIDEFNELTEEARELAIRYADELTEAETARLQELEDRIKLLERTIENSVNETIEDDIIRGLDNPCL